MSKAVPENTYAPVKSGAQDLPDTWSDFLNAGWQRSELPGANIQQQNPQTGEMETIVDETRVMMTNPKTGEVYPLDAFKKISQQKRDEQHAATMAKQGLMPDGTPIAPEMLSFIDPNTGLMRESYQYEPEKIDLSKLEGFQALRKRVLTEGPSAWAQMMLEKQKIEEAQARDDAAKQAMSASQQASAELAMRGGMTSGARERLAGGGGKNLMMARQGVARAGELSRSSTLTEDERQRMSLLPGFAEGEANLNKYNVDVGNKAATWNIEQALKEQDAMRAWEQEKYKEQMAKWAAERQAQATERAGGGGGGGTWLCTEIHKHSPLTKKDALALTKLRKFSMRENKKFTRCYVYECGELANRMNKARFNWGDLKWFVDKITSLVYEGKMKEAFNIYCDVTFSLVELFWKDTDNLVLKELLSLKKA